MEFKCAAASAFTLQLVEGVPTNSAAVYSKSSIHNPIIASAGLNLLDN